MDLRRHEGLLEGSAAGSLARRGRDPSATLDSATGGFGSNEGDNEITGVLVSNGDPGPQGLLGARNPNLWNSGGEWRWFWTQQHGDNFTWQVELAK